MEKFIYSAEAKVIRKKTLNFSQKIIMYSMWILITACMLGGIILQQNGRLPSGTMFLMVIIFAPLALGLFLMIYIILNPLGPEADFELPGFETDLSDSSTLQGKILLADKSKVEVEVIVPNVYSPATDLIGNDGLQGLSDGLAYEEMFEMALEEIRKKYPACAWEELPKTA